MDSAEELQSYINKLQLAVEQGRQKLLEGKTEVGLKRVVFDLWLFFFFVLAVSLGTENHEYCYLLNAISVADQLCTVNLKLCSH